MKKVLIQRYQQIAQVENLLALCLCIMVICGWALDFDVLTRGIIYSNPMHPLAGTTCILVVIAHYSLVQRSLFNQWLPSLLASLVMGIGFVRLVEYGTGLETDIFNTVYAEVLFPSLQAPFAPITAVCFVFLGCSMLLFKTRVAGIYPTDWLCLSISLIAFARLVTYLYGGAHSPLVTDTIEMSFLTAVSLFLLSTAILLSQNTLSFFKLFTSQHPGSRMARYLVPFALLLPIVTGLLYTLSKGFYFASESVTLPLIILLNVVIMVALIWRSSLSLNKSAVALEHERLHSEQLKERLRNEENKQLQNELMQVKIDQQKALMHATIEGQEKEKKKLGMELHDHINQILASTKLYLEIAETNATLSQQMVTKSKLQVAEAIHEIRQLSHSLVLNDTGPESVLQDIASLFIQVREATGLRIHSDVSAISLLRLPREIQVGIFRILQEQLQNVTKHANAEYVHVILTDAGDEIYFEVTDNGKGFDPGSEAVGIGLKNIRSRVAAMDGEFKLQSAPGYGCQLSIIVPIPTFA